MEVSADGDFSDTLTFSFFVGESVVIFFDNFSLDQGWSGLGGSGEWIVGPAAAHSNVGAIMAKQGRRSEAQRAFQQALSLNPSLEQPRAFLAYYAQHSSQPEAAWSPEIT